MNHILIGCFRYGYIVVLMVYLITLLLHNLMLFQEVLGRKSSTKWTENKVATHAQGNRAYECVGDVIVIRGELPPRREIPANPEAQIKGNNIEQFLSQEHIQINSHSDKFRCCIHASTSSKAKEAHAASTI